MKTDRNTKRTSTYNIKYNENNICISIVYRMRITRVKQSEEKGERERESETNGKV